MKIELEKSGNFKFETKAKTLENVSPLLTKFKTLNQLFFNLGEWERNKEEIIQKIISLFGHSEIIVRSSAVNEDTKNSSMAGNYKSILDVNGSDSSEITRAVDLVRESYNKDHQTNYSDEILIQPQIKEAAMSGVIFTRCPNTSSPYYIINYDDSSGRTDTITSGKSSSIKTFNYFKYSENLPSNKNLLNLIHAVKEVEEKVNSDLLDLEFAIDKKGEMFLLQLRPITTIRDPEYSKIDHQIKNSILNIKNLIMEHDKKFPNLCGYKALFGLMPDWNPAEIIGEFPRPLAFSLYRELITDEIWPRSRKEIGYRDVGYHPGIISLGGKPYVDVRLSFNTLIPEDISESTSEKLVNFYIDKLINNPEMHDKIEFNIALTCYKVGFEKENEELKQNNFSNAQIKEINESLIKLTNNIINGNFSPIKHLLNLNEIMNSNRKKIMNSEIGNNIRISQLIHDAKYYGTLPFSKLARFAFIGNIILNSLVENNVISEKEKENFFKSINSVASEFLIKLDKVRKGEITREGFLKEFGHLRPGTYDITSKTYSDSFDEYFDLEKNEDNMHEVFNFEFSQEKKEKISEALRNEGFDFNAETFLTFSREAIAGREKSKFEFTKNLSSILDYCQKYLEKYSFSKDDISFLEIKDIVSFNYKSDSTLEISELKEKIRRNKEEYKITKALKLPPLVYLLQNAEYFHYYDNRPNFITNENISGELFILENEKDLSKINGKIVLVSNADPGYDWIFSRNIRGLITKYGGVASHMAIRCVELGVPAAIGCGSTIFDYLLKFKKIELNCFTNQIKGIS